jgi:hypothetical protein
VDAFDEVTILKIKVFLESEVVRRYPPVILQDLGTDAWICFHTWLLGAILVGQSPSGMARSEPLSRRSGGSGGCMADAGLLIDTLM